MMIKILMCRMSQNKTSTSLIVDCFRNNALLFLFLLFFFFCATGNGRKEKESVLVYKHD